MNLIIIGAPGAGKGTMSEAIISKYGISHISTGDMFRNQIERQTLLGMQAKEYMDKGELVPDSVTINMVRERIKQDDCQKGYLLDGFPRNNAQAEVLMEMLADINLNLDAVIYMDVDFNAIIKRVTGRRICRECKSVYHIDFSPSKISGICDKCGGELYQRSDDTEESLKQRLNAYMDETIPVIEYFRKKSLIRDINANQAIEKVSSDLFAILEEIK